MALGSQELCPWLLALIRHFIEAGAPWAGTCPALPEPERAGPEAGAQRVLGGGYCPILVL